MSEDISEERLGAYLDGELTEDERRPILQALQSDAALRDRLCTLSTTRELVRAAYAAPPAARARAGAPRSGWPVLARSLAAGLLLALGLAGGWLLRGPVPDATPAEGLLGFLPGEVRPVHLGGPRDGRRVLLHIDSAEPARTENLLEYAQEFLEAADREGVAVRLEVVANFDGLEVLRSSATPAAARLADLARRADRFELVACGNTVARLQRRGESVDLAPGVRVAPSAVAEIVTRLQQGWIYIKV
jgi:hypothetical protein